MLVAVNGLSPGHRLHFALIPPSLDKKASGAYWVKTSSSKKSEQEKVIKPSKIKIYFFIFLCLKVQLTSYPYYPS